MINEKIKCKICGSPDVRKKFDNDDRVLQCQKCRVAFLSPETVNYAPDKYYSEEAGYSNIIADDKRLAMIEGNALEVLKIIRKWKGSGYLLDAGAHTGIFVREANRNGFNAVGIEPDAGSVKWANDNNIPLFHSSIEAFSSDKMFDVITISHVLEHVADPVFVLNKLKNLLKANGLLVIEVPDTSSYLAKKDGLSWKFIAQEHLFYFSKKNLRELLENLGLGFVTARQRNYEINYLSRGKLLHYFFGRGLARDRFQPKNRSIHQENVTVDAPGFYKRLAKRALVFMVNLLKRQDHVLIIAQKI